MASRSVQPFLHSSRQRGRVHILYNGPSKLPLPMGALDPRLIHGCLSHPSPHNPNGISIGSSVFAGLKTVTDRPTDRPRYSVCNNRPHQLMLRRGLLIIIKSAFVGLKLIAQNRMFQDALLQAEKQVAGKRCDCDSQRCDSNGCGHRVPGDCTGNCDGVEYRCCSPEDQRPCDSGSQVSSAGHGRNQHAGTQ